MYIDTRHEKARELRHNGKSYDEIARTVNAGLDTVKKWTKDVIPDPAEFNKRNNIRISKIKARRSSGKTLASRIYKLRKRGFSYKEISDKTKIAKGTISYWCKKFGLTLPVKRKAKRISYFINSRRKNWENTRTSIIDAYVNQLVKQVPKNIVFAMGVCWYMAEGNKRKVTAFCNQDPNVILFMKRFFETYFPNNSLKFRITVSWSSWHKRKRFIKKWKKLLNVKKISLNEAKFSKGKRQRDNYIGLCTIRVSGKYSTYIPEVLCKLWAMLQSLKIDSQTATPFSAKLLY